MDANPALMGTVVAINEQSMVINSAKVKNLLSREGYRLTQTGSSFPALVLVMVFVFAWASDTNNGYPSKADELRLFPTSVFI